MHDTLDGVEALRERFRKYHVLEKIAQGGMASSPSAPQGYWHR